MTILGALPGVASHIPSWFHTAPEVQDSELSFLQNIPFTPPSLAPKPSQASSLLTRQSVDYTQTLTEGQRRVDQFGRAVTQQVQSPTNLLLLAGVGSLARSVQWSFRAEETLLVSRNLAAGFVKSRALVALPLGLTACAAGSDGFDSHFQTGRDGGTPDLRPDAGPVPDEDRDGADAEVDCDDHNPNVFPLVGPARLIEIRRSTTICPGVYNGFSLRVPSGVKDIQLVGEDVILDGRVKDKPTAGTALRVINGDNVEISGFRVLYYDEPVGVVGMVAVEASRNVQLHDLNITGNKGNWPIRLTNSDDTVIEDVTTQTHADRALKLENCKRTMVKNSYFNSATPYDYGAPGYALVHVEGGVNNTLVGCHLYTGQNHGLYVKDSMSFQGLELTISGNAKSGIFLDGAKNGYYRDSKVNNNGEYGLYLQRRAMANTFWKNDFTVNTVGAYGTRFDASLTENNFMENTPQP